MNGSIRRDWRIAAAGLGLLLGACTVEDASDKRAADSAAAATAPGAGQSATGAGAAGSQTGAMAGQPAGTTPTGGATDTGMAAGTIDSAGAGGGNLSPDSVDVGRSTKAKLLPLASTRIEVDLGAKQLYVFDGDKRVGSYRVAVGSTEWPTQAGEWSITQVVWNPEWIPPKDESWAEARDPKKSGAPDNPLGRAQLIYDPPRTIHGTNDPQSIGKAVSHGSIRLANADVMRLARQLMEVTGVEKDEAWYRQVQRNRTEKVVIDLPQRVAIKVS
ncbi:MAG TPA: L,D-transpeptidase [Gemmatimonadaceae bacterium]|nr:L,D-transpeptidase [Gemmatimonadaceae bacterium]